MLPSGVEHPMRARLPFMLAIPVAMVCAGSTACTAHRPPPPKGPAPVVKESVDPFRGATDEPGPATAWGTFHSKRFRLAFPLPDGRSWRIDDHSRPALFAVHASSGSRLSLIATDETELMNRERCETRAKALGMVPASELVTVADEVTVAPGTYDSRVWVAVDPNVPGGKLEGHVFLFGASVRRCLLVHFTTTAAPSGGEALLSSRLALARARVVGEMVLDSVRTTSAAEVPRTPQDRRR